MPKIADVVHRPAVHFDEPAKLVETTTLTNDEKLVALQTWEKDADALDLAADEGMLPGREEEPLRDKIEQAKDALLGGEKVNKSPTKDDIELNRKVKI